MQHWCLEKADHLTIQLDWLGYILIAVGQILFCVGLTWAQNPCEFPPGIRCPYDVLTRSTDPWKSAQVLAPFLIGLAVTALFVVYETVFKKDGLVHHDLFRYHKYVRQSLHHFPYANSIM